MIVTRHIAFEIKGDFTTVGTSIDDFSGDTSKNYYDTLEDYISDCRGSEFLHSFPINIKRVWYEVEQT